ncbi:MAG: tetratricopeptide (TPR) repeat protein [Planctomycetota bacterium]|jgi:tetratricopeptide (TPR) repeat protein
MRTLQFGQSSRTRLQGRSGLTPYAVLCLAIGACSDSNVISSHDDEPAKVTLSIPVAPNLSTLDAGVAFVVQRAIEQVRLAPESFEARFELGMTFDANSLFEAAVEAYEQTTQIAPAHAPAHYHGARMLRQLGRLEESRASIERALQLDLNYAPAHRRSADWFLQAGEFDAAERGFTRVHELEPGWPDGALGLARLALLRDEAQQAMDLASAVTATHPENTYAQHLLGSALRDLGRLDESETAFALSAGGVPSWNDPWVDQMETRLGGYSRIMFEAKACLDQGLYEEAVKRLAILQQQTPDDITLLGMWTAALTKLSRNEEALQLLLAARERGVKHFRLELNLATVRWKQSEFDLALEHIERSIELSPNHETIYLVQGQIFQAKNDPKNAITSFEMAMRLGSDQQRVLPRIGKLQMDLEHWDMAAITYTRAALLIPNDASIHATLAGCLTETGDRDGARVAIARAKQIDPSHKLIPMIEARMAELNEERNP